MKKYNVAIVGATGLVGRTFIKILEEYNFPINNLLLLASKRSEGVRLDYKQKEYTVHELTKNSFCDVDIALFSAGADISEIYAPIAAKSGAIVIDNSSAWRMNKKVPLIVPEINLDSYKNEHIIANPNCSTIQAVIPLMVICDHYGIKRVTYTTYQAVSGSGQDGIDDLKRTLNGDKPMFYPHDISKTCIPEIDKFLDDGYTKEENKMIDETRKILNLLKLPISATCIRVPVLNSHGVMIQVETKEKVDLIKLKEYFKENDTIVLMDDDVNHQYPTSTVANGTDKVYVGRLRYDSARKNSILLYTVSDNVRKGAASNAVQIACKLIEKGIL